MTGRQKVEVGTALKSKSPVRLGERDFAECDFRLESRYFNGTVAMVCKMRLAILYGSPCEFGRRSSR